MLSLTIIFQNLKAHMAKSLRIQKMDIAHTTVLATCAKK
jgi:hypothetical protein